MPKARQTESKSPLTRDLVAAVDAGPERKAAAESIGLTRGWLDKIASGKGRMSLDHAEVLAPQVGLSLELVNHADPVSEFRRALDANREISRQWRDTIWGAFRQAKSEALAAEAPPRRKRSRAAASSE
jgi:hypothetical protein